jgi:hypothetical protein
MYSGAIPRRSVIQAFGAITATGAVMPIRAGAEADVPRPIVNNLVKVARQHWNGRDCLAVELTDEEQRGRLAKTRTSNGPSYAIVHRSFSAGVIESDVGAELNGKGAADARGFVGFAFHLSDDLQRYEAVYLRMTNGRRNDPAPPPPRIDRAIQYVAHPDFHFAVSRANFPGRYEKGADIGAGRWHRLRLEVRGAQVRALVDGVVALTVDDLHYADRGGPVGLFVDDGTRGLFANLNIAPW